MNIEEAQDCLAQHCQEMFEKNVPGSLFSILGTLIEAEEENLIRRNWRSQMNVDALVAFIKNNQSKIEEEWERQYKQLKRITDYGGKMEFEEMILILSLRSSLQSGQRFVKVKSNNIFANLDEDLKAILEINRECTRDSRYSNRKHTGGIETYLKNHWWWRYDEEN